VQSPSASASTPATSGVSTAEKNVAALEAPVTFTPAGPQITVGNRLDGKSIYAVVNGISYPFVQSMLNGLKQAAAALGMTVTAVDGNGSASTAANLIEQGVAEKASVIVVESFPAEQIAASLQEAKAAGIPVIELTSRDPQLPTTALKNIGVSAIDSFCYSCAGQQMADYAVANTDGHLDAVLFDVPEIGVSSLEKNGFISEVKKLCPTTCKVTTVEAPLAQWSTELPSLTTSALQRDPNVNFLVPEYDSMVQIMAPAVSAAQATTVKVVSYNGTQPALTMLSEGQLVAGDVGGMNTWLGWAAADQVARVLTGNPPVVTDIPDRIFTSSNISSINISAGETTWYGNIDLAASYEEQWGLG
jgi:ribose transport system substrate-binding protein